MELNIPERGKTRPWPKAPNFQPSTGPAKVQATVYGQVSQSPQACGHSGGSPGGVFVVSVWDVITVLWRLLRTYFAGQESVSRPLLCDVAMGVQ